MQKERAIVIGAGIGGLSAAIQLAARGVSVTVIERLATPGGKLRQVKIGEASIDAGPTVLTLKQALDHVFVAAGTRLEDHVTLTSARVLARHAWPNGGQLDLFANQDETISAIEAFAGVAEADGYRAFCAEAENIYRILDRSFIRDTKPTLPQLMWRIGLHRIRDQLRINPYQTLWNAIKRHFRDPRLRQLFARYSTYCGSSPFSAPATLMLIAHVERQGVWLVDGGMYRVVEALERVGQRLGVHYRYQSQVCDIRVKQGRAAGVLLTSGETLEADIVIANADVSAVSAGRLGHTAAYAVKPVGARSRSLSALTWAFTGNARGFLLARHTVFFPDTPYENEFDAIFRRGKLPANPTIYVCSQDRDSEGESQAGETERFLCIVNAPPALEVSPLNEMEIQQCETKAFDLMKACGLHMEKTAAPAIRMAPLDFETLFPGTEGMIYGRASHGWMSSFLRQGTRCRIPGLYFAGGSVHPGPGVPMAAYSGTLAAQAALKDFALRRLFHRMAMPGGILMPSVKTAATD